jgi:hypothetical protein
VTVGKQHRWQENLLDTVQAWCELQANSPVSPLFLRFGQEILRLWPVRRPGHQQSRILVVAAALLALGAACNPANERPVRGAVPGNQVAPTPPGVPPTLEASEALRFRALPTPSPGVVEAVPSPSAMAIASPSVVVAAPPIVRTIAPSANAHVPAGPTTLSAVLVGRGADLASASLALNGADTGAEIDKRTPREWSIHASQTLPSGTHTARVLVSDDSGAHGGFTWQFEAGDAAPPTEDPQPTAPPAAKPAAPPPPPTAKPAEPTPNAKPAAPAPATSPVPKPRAP